MIKIGKVIITPIFETDAGDLAAKGLVNKDIPINQGRIGPRYFFIEDPDGILVEIAEDKREF